MARKKVMECNIEITEMEIPNKAYGYFEDKKIEVKNRLVGQKLKVVCKKSRGRYKTIFSEVIEKSPNEIEPKCKDFNLCGGCTFQNLRYEDELNLKEKLVLDLLNKEEIHINSYLGIEKSPQEEEYRNKMEYSFGDFEKGSQLALGMRKRNSMYEVVTSEHCNIVDEDFRKILDLTLDFFQNTNETFYHKKLHTGTLRHLLVRKAYYTGEIMVALVTTSDVKTDINNYKDILVSEEYKGKMSSVFHIINDSFSDAVKCDEIKNIYGNEFIMDKLSGLDFTITPFSFFQTNTQGAERLYSNVIEFLGTDTSNKVVFDLFSGTGTIGQIIAPKVKKVISIEIVEEAVEAAKLNHKLNLINNIEFHCGDVFEVLNTMDITPDFIIIDPPRNGLSQKTIEKILSYNLKDIIYVSCNPITLARDLKIFNENGYEVGRMKLVDMFPRTYHVECVVLMTRVRESVWH